MKGKVALAGVMLIGTGLACHALAAEQPAEDKCASSAELSFVCGPKHPEDLVVLPGNRWIVSSGMTTASGLNLIDTKTKMWERWIAPSVAAAQKPYDKCPSQPKADELQAHGISVRDRGNGRATLYVVNHGSSRPVDPSKMNIGDGRETIEVFDVDTSGAKPVLSWVGCVPMPGLQLVANSVVSAPDGSIYATVMVLPDSSVMQMFKQEITGAVYKWTPGSAEFKRMDGTELSGNNGIELSSDGKTLYVASSYGAITSFTNTSPARRIRSAPTKIGVADNLHWVNKRLLITGQRTDLCRPGDARAKAGGGTVWAPGMPCMAGYYVAAVNPKSLALTVLAKGGINPEFYGATTGLPIGNTLWIGSVALNRIAYRKFP